MKVAVIIDTWFPYLGGGQINAYEISKRLAKLGTEIEIITRDNGKENLRLTKNLKITKLGGYAKPLEILSRITFLVKVYFYVSKQNFDLVHAHAFIPGIIARFLMITRGIPAIFTVHGTSINTNLLNPLARLIEKFILIEILYSAQITVSQDFLKLKNINKNIIYIPNGVNIKNSDKINPKKFKNPTLIFVGRLHPQKNLTTLLQCINTLKQKFPLVQLLIVGDGEEKGKLKTLIKNLGLTKNIKLLGEIRGKQLTRLYKSSHIFVLPSIYEGQPITLLEAWAAKLPVIVTKSGDCQLLIKNGVNGYLIDNPQDPEEIASVITKALANINLEKLGLNGYNLVKKNFSWEKSAQQTLKVYESLA